MATLSGAGIITLCDRWNQFFFTYTFKFELFVIPNVTLSAKGENTYLGKPNVRLLGVSFNISELIINCVLTWTTV